MTENVKPFPCDKSLSALGVNVKAPKIGADLTLASGSLNLSTGVQDGIGPRFGMAPLSNHSTWETLQSGYLGGLAYTEDGSTAAASQYVDRRKVFGVFPVTMGNFTTPGVPFYPRTYVWILGKKVDASYDFIDATVGVTAEATSGGFVGTSYQPRAELAAGFSVGANKVGASAIDRILFLCPDASTWETFVQTRFTQPTTVGYLNCAAITISGRDVPMEWIFGLKNTIGSATVPCEGAYFTSLGGVPTPWSTRQFRNSLRSVSIYDVDSVNGLQYQFIYAVMTVDSALIYGEGHYQTATGSKLIPSGLPAATAVVTRLDGAGSVAASVDYQVINDTDNSCNSGYTLFCAAGGGNPAAFFSKTWVRPFGNRLLTPVDLTHVALAPAPLDTQSDAGGGARYTEDGTTRQTCFLYWPAFVSGTALQTDAAATQTGTIHVTLGGANTGVLRANTDYEFTYSIYCKLTNSETNVGAPARFRTGTDEFVALSIYRDPTSTGAHGGTLRQRDPIALTQFPVSTQASGSYTPPANYLEHRFYYRPYGSYEWLPALFIDTAKFFRFTNNAVLWTCAGAIAGLPGGQPGGFNDYSPLAQGNYIDCAAFQERMFWATEQAIQWSYRQNVFAYAGRNSAAIATGTVRGFKVHVNKGQRIESNGSRILICGSDAIYTGRFTGEPNTQPVQVSPDTVLEFPLEGSDFLIEFWTSFTAFSSRAMVIGDGNLYYWGPNGVFFDAGLGDPVRISPNLEPDIFQLIDDTKTNQVFGTFSETTQEVFWFYPPRGGDGTTTGILSYNVKTQEFQYGVMAGQIDGAQLLQVDKEAVDWKGLAGQRALLFTRANAAQKIQRAYYFDQRCLGGDNFPFKDLLAFSATLISGSDWRFRLCLGSNDNTNFATIAAGDYISALQFSAYTRSYADNDDDFIGLVVAVGNDGTRNYIDLRLPSTITLNSTSPVTFPATRVAPLWHRSAAGAGLNGFAWNLTTNYWAPAGVDFEAFWKFLHLIFSVNLVASRLRVRYTLGSQTPQRPDPFNVDYLFRDNFDGHDQTLAPLFFEDQALMSQAVKVILSGYQIGSHWVLQYLAAHGSMTGRTDFLKEFEPEKA